MSSSRRAARAPRAGTARVLAARGLAETALGSCRPAAATRGGGRWALTNMAVARSLLLLLLAAPSSVTTVDELGVGRLSLAAVERFLKPPPPPPASECSLRWQRALEAAGALSVLDFVVDADGTDAAPAARRAINASRACRGGVVTFPARRQGYDFSTTVVVEHIAGLQLRGSGGAVAEFTVPPQVEIRGPKLGPAFLFRSSEKISLQDLNIVGGSVAVLIADCAVIRVTNSAMTATTVPVGTVDDVNTSVAGCNGCNVVLGSENAALIVENSFWISFADSTFVFAKSGRPISGQRPSVILRGANHTAEGGGGGKYNVNTVYIVRFERIVFVGGGVQYQQLTAGWQWPGWYATLVFHACLATDVASLCSLTVRLACASIS
jgi:hypothetical protein